MLGYLEQFNVLILHRCVVGVSNCANHLVMESFVKLVPTKIVMSFSEDGRNNRFFIVSK